MREHLVSAWLQSDEMPEELAKAAALPEAARYLWEHYVQIHNRRTNYGWGHIPLSFIEIEAWKRAKKVRLDPWELDALLDVDDAYIAQLPKPKTEGPT